MTNPDTPRGPIEAVARAICRIECLQMVKSRPLTLSMCPPDCENWGEFMPEAQAAIDAYKQGDLFIEPPAKPEQVGMDI